MRSIITILICNNIVRSDNIVLSNNIVYSVFTIEYVVTQLIYYNIIYLL